VEICALDMFAVVVIREEPVSVEAVKEDPISVEN
jgi:hypothetical protein